MFFLDTTPQLLLFAFLVVLFAEEGHLRSLDREVYHYEVNFNYFTEISMQNKKIQVGS